MKIKLSILAFLGVVCPVLADIAISPSSIDYAAAGGGAAVKTSGTGNWTATTDVSWITIVRASGAAGSSCMYTVSKNSNADTREGHITIAGNVYTVTQKGCPVELSSTSISVTRAGGAGEVTASMDANVSWTVDVSESWISVFPMQGTGAAVLTYVIEPSEAVGTRTGTIRIGSEKLTVTQTGVDVTLSIATTNVTKDVCLIPVQVYALVETTWSVTPNVSWISVLDSGLGRGGSQITVVAAENPSYEKRTGTVSVGSAVLTVIQAGTDDLSFKILPEYAEASPKGAFANVAVYATPDATWSAESMDSWIKITAGAEGAGNGNLKYVTMSNPELTERTGRIKFTPPIFVPDLDIYAGLSLWIQDQDNVEGNVLRRTTYPLSREFDGTFSNPLSGEKLPANENGEYTISVTFKVGELDRVNRLFSIGKHSVFLDMENLLNYQDVNTGFVFDSVEDCYTMVVRVDSQSCVSIYLGAFGAELELVARQVMTDVLDCTRGVDPAEIVLGYASYPSVGNLSAGRFFDIRFWSRALTDVECECVDSMSDDMLDSCPRGGSEVVDYCYFPLSGNMFAADETGKIIIPETSASTSGGCLPAVGRFGQNHRAFSVKAEKNLCIEDFGSLFDSTFVTNQGYALDFEHYGRGGIDYPSGGDYCIYPSPTEISSGVDATYSFWIKMNAFPSDQAVVFERKMAETYKEEIVHEIDTYYDNFGYLRTGYEMSYERYNFSSAWDDSRAFDIREGGGTFNSVFYFYSIENQFGDVSENYDLQLVMDKMGRLTCSQQACRPFWKTTAAEAEGMYAPCNYMLEPMSVKSISFDTYRLTTNQWHMITIQGIGRQTITVFVDGDEIGNVPTQMVFGDIPAINLSKKRHYSRRTCDVERYSKHNLNLIVGGWNGEIDEMTFYHRALSAREIRDVYQAGLPAQNVYHTVHQGIQQPTVTPDTIRTSHQGATTSVELTVAKAVNWEAVPSEDWISIVGASRGTGQANVGVKINPNTTCYSRTGTVAIGPAALTIEQDGLNCTLVAEKTIFPSEADETGGMGIIEVSPENGGSWVAESDVDWIACWPEEGSGSADVYFFVEDFEDSGASRTGTITIGGKTIRITQRGYDLSIDPAVADVGGNAGAGVIGVAADPDAIWTAIADEPWITIVASSGDGVGPGTVRYTYTDNTTGETRTGHIRIAGEEYVITQTCTLELKTTVVGEGAVTGGGNYAQGKTATLTAIPSSGYSFSHWSGDMVGVEASQTIKMDSVKNVTATFIPESAAQKLAEQKAAQGGFYTRDQIHNLEVGNLVLDVDSTTGKARIGVQLQETSDLSNPNWQPVNVTAGDLDIGNDGTVGIQATATGNAKFFRVVTPSK